MTTTKVYEVARKWAVDSKDMVGILRDMGIEVKSHMSALSPEDVKRVAEVMSPTTKPVEQKPEKKQEELSKAAAPKKTAALPRSQAEGRPSRSVSEKPSAEASPHKTAAAPKEPVTKTPEQKEEKAAKVQSDTPARQQEEKTVRPSGDKHQEEATPKQLDDRSSQGDGHQGDRPPRQSGDRLQSDNRPQGDRQQRPHGDRPQGDRQQRAHGDRPQGDRQQRAQSDNRQPRQQGERQQRQQRPYGDRPQGERQQRPHGDRPQGDRQQRPYGDRPQGDRQQRPHGDRPQGDRQQRPYGDRPQGDRQQRPYGDRPQGDRQQRPYGDRPQGDRQQRPYGDRPQGDRQQRPYGDRPQGDRQQRPYGDRPQRPQGGSFDKDKDAASQNRSANRSGEKKAGGEKPAAKAVVKKFEGRKRKDEKDTKKEKLERLEKAGGFRDKNIRTGKTARKAKAAKEAKKREVIEILSPEEQEERSKSIMITVPITVKGFAEQIKRTTSDVIVKLMKLGVMANINQNIDEDMVLLLGEELGVKIMIEKVEDEMKEVGIEDFKDRPEDLKERPPIVTVMGHVDHGKTSLLDAIRSTSITKTESGGITQHIGASAVRHNGKKIMFLDTPGHEAFTTMRARGAQVTDIAILVVAADDGVKPQTVEAISHAKAAGVSIIIAINKIDKPTADPSRVKQELTEHNILVEEWGGDVIAVEVSAKAKKGIDELLEMVLLQADVLELKANPHRLAKGTVIEARLDKAKGPVLNMIVETGTLHVGDSIVAGNYYGKVRAMTNSKGVLIKKAGPVTAVEVLGLSDVPEAGDAVHAIKDDKAARTIAENRQKKIREEVMKRTSHVTLDDLFDQIQKGNLKELNLIVKADVQGSAGALIQSLEKLSNDDVKIKIIHSGVGTFTESDVILAATSNAILIGFNVRPTSTITTMAEREHVEIKTSRIIYEIIDDIEAAMKGMLDPEYKEVVIGKIEVRTTFKVPGVGVIAGAYVLEGKVERNARVRLTRDSIIIHEGKISSLKRFKDDAKEVAKGYECGIGIENYNDLKEGDIIEAYKMEEIERK